jgi:penicillin-binding protein 2
VYNDINSKRQTRFMPNLNSTKAHTAKSITNQTSKNTHIRLLVSTAFILFCFTCLISRLFWLQVSKHNNYAAKAENNRISILPIIPSRGLIFDRNGIILAQNTSSFILEITPSKLKQSVSETIDLLSKKITIQNIDIQRFKNIIKTSKLASAPIRNQLNAEEIARISIMQPKIEGVEIKSRMLRHYPLNDLGAHILGYIGRISTKDEHKLEQISIANEMSKNYTPFKDADNYLGSNHIGKTGIEQSYEFDLHGLRGHQKVEVNANGQAVQVLSTKTPLAGNDIILSIDVKLQKIIEHLYGDRNGALVAIQPSTGEVLAFVSKPTFNPNLFIDGIDQDNWKLLNENDSKPLLNRALKSTYPPGSTYKPFMALAALTAGYTTLDRKINDTGSFVFGNHIFGSSKGHAHGIVNLHQSIVHSSNVYYYTLARDMGVDIIHKTLQPFGFGLASGIDLEGENKGILPSKDWKRRAYKNTAQEKWVDGETISLGIGQGYNNFTITQLAQATTIIANRGQIIQPRLVKNIYNPNYKKTFSTLQTQINKLDIKPEYMEAVIQAMADVNKQGTSAKAFSGAPYASAGKTGTVQVFSLKRGQTYNARGLQKQLQDHSLFIAFAPIDNPKIALALIVENGGFGAQSAAPIARKVFDYVLLNQIPAEIKDIIDNIHNQENLNMPNTENIENTVKNKNTKSSQDAQNMQNAQQVVLELNPKTTQDLINAQKKALSLPDNQNTMFHVKHSLF